MTGRLFAYLSPALLSVIIPFLMNHHQKINNLTPPTGNSLPPDFAKNALKSLLTTAVFLIIIGLAVWLTPANSSALNIGRFLKLCFFLLSFSLFLITFYYLLHCLKLSGNLIQVAVSLAALLISTTIFWMNPLIESSAGNQTLKQSLINIALNYNPMTVLAANFFHDDLMRAPVMYNYSIIGVSYYSYAAWWKVAAGYTVLSMIFLAMGQSILRLRLRNTTPAGP